MKNKAGSLNPFPGLRPFRQDEDYLFFGREEQTMELLQRLGHHRFVAVVGTSGSGKSSLVRCGLWSELLGGKLLRAGAAWEVAVTHPGGNPLGLLVEALLDADLYDREEESVRENLLATLSRSHFGLVEAVKQARLGADTNFLLVVDQFEEIFRFHEAGQTQQEAANEYVSLLLEAVAQTELPIYIVLTMRSDFIGDCGQFEGLAEMVNRGEFLIPRLTREQYKRVIESPIKVAGGNIARRLLQRLLNDLGQQADQLPCLQHALMRTWTVWAARGDSEALDLDDYQRVGKMSQALSLHADEIYDSLADDRQRSLCAGLFQALTVQESESRGIRRPQRLGRLCRILDVSAEELIPIIDAYRHAGVTFLMPSPEVTLTEQTIIDISHESLMRVWTRLRRWVEEEAQAVGIYRRLSESAGLYSEGKAGLYRDPELGIALAWQADKRPNQAWAERYYPGFESAIEFLERSQQAQLAEERAHEEARKHELDQARKLAEAERQRAELEQRAARRLRVLAAGMALVAVFALGATLVAVNFWVASDAAKWTAQLSEQSAQQSAQSAQQSAQAAQREAQRATAQEAIATGARQDAEDNLTRARTAIDEFLVQVSDSQLLSTPGLQPLRANLLESASKFYAEFLTKNPDDPLLQAGLADAFYRVGFVNGDLGHHEQALVVLEKAIALQEAALQAQPNDAALRHRLAKAWYECSRNRLESGDYQGGDDAARHAARLWDALCVEFPEDIDYSKSLARACNILGNTGSRLNQPDRAYLAYQRSMQIRLALLELHPQDVELLHGLGESFNNIGQLIADSDQRLQLSNRSIEYSTVAHRLSPQNVEYATDLAISLYVNAGRWLALNRRPQALEVFRKGNDHALQFIRANPAVPAMREHLQYQLRYLRSIAFDAAQADDYAAIFRNVRNTFAELPRQTADDHLAFAQAQSDCAQQSFRAHRTFQNRALTPQEEAEIAAWRAGSVASLREAIALGFKDVQRLKQDPLLADARTQPAFNELVAQMETTGQAPPTTGTPAATGAATLDAQRRFTQDRAAGYLAFGLAETWLEQASLADKSLEQALALRETLAAAAPENISLLAELAEVREAQARLFRSSGRLAKARDLYVYCIEQLERAIPGPPGNPAVGRGLTDADSITASKELAAVHREYADFLVESGLWDEAVAQYAKSLQESLKYRTLQRKQKPAGQVDVEAVYEEILAPMLSLLDSADRSYPDACRQILTKYRENANSEQAARVARLCILAPNAVADLSPVLALTDKAQYSWHGYTRGLVLYRSGRFDEAIRVIDAALQKKDISGLGVEDFVLAMAHFRAGRQEQARTFLSAANRKTPRSMSEWAHSPHNMLDVDWLVLRREANQLIHGSPFDPDDRLRRGRAYAQLGALDKADAELTALVAARADDPHLHLIRARVLWALGKTEPAAQALDRARQLLEDNEKASVDDVELWRAAAETYRLLDRPDDALAAQRLAVTAQSMRVITAPQQYTERWLLRKLYDELSELLPADGREAKAAAARAEFDSLLVAFGIPPVSRTIADVFAETKTRASADAELLAALDRLIATYENPTTANDSVHQSLRGRLHQRRAEVLRDAGRSHETTADLSAARQAYEQLSSNDASNAAVAQSLADVLLELQQPKWTVLQPAAALSASGTTLTTLPDRSVLAGGKLPDVDTYTISAAPTLPEVVAVRLETLTDASLPFNGPGRYGNGVFQLTEIEAFPGAGDQLAVAALAVFDRAVETHSPEGGWGTSANAIDRNPATYWSIYQGTGRPQSAVFRLRKPMRTGDGTGLTFKLQFLDRQYAKSTLGRFRLSVTDDVGQFEQDARRFAAMKLADPWAKLGAAYALAREPAKAVDHFVSAMKKTADPTKKRELAGQIVALVAEQNDVLDELARRHHQQPQLQLEVAKLLASRGRHDEAAALRGDARQMLNSQFALEPENSALAAELADLLLESSAVEWTALQPTEMKSTGGATLTRLDDQSILAEGLNPPAEQYTVRFVVPERTAIQAIRLESLTHDSLPGQGPGRATKGTAGVFALDRWDLTTTGREGADSLRPLSFHDACASYSWNNAPLNLRGAWNLTYGQGKDQSSVWSLPDRVTLEAGAELQSDMRFNPNPDWSDQNLGRFRISVSSDPAAFDREQQRFAAVKLSDPWAKLGAAYILAGDFEPAADLLAKSPAKAKELVAAWFNSGLPIDGILDPLKDRAPVLYTKILPDIADAAAERGQFDSARSFYSRLAEREPTNPLWKQRTGQLQPGALAVWNFDTGPGAWGTVTNCELSVKDGVLTARTTGGDPHFQTLTSGPAGGKALVLRYRTDEAFVMQVFWADASGGLSDARHLDYPVPASAGAWREITLPFACQGALKTLRLDPNTVAAHPLEVDSLVLRHLEPVEYRQLATEVLIEPELARLAREIEANPKTAAKYSARGTYLTQLGRWSEAAEDFERELKLTPQARITWFKTANCLLLAGDSAGYQQHCRAMVEQFRETRDSQIADSVCKTCLLGPAAIELSDLPIQLLRDATADPKQENVRTWFVACCALISYREGNSEEAIAWVKKHPNLAGYPGSLALVVRAMAEYQLGQHDQARQTLAQAETLIPAELRTLGTSDYSGPLPASSATVAHDWLTPEILRREAATLIRGTADSGP